jgi:hypothetical protein
MMELPAAITRTWPRGRRPEEFTWEWANGEGPDFRIFRIRFRAFPNFFGEPPAVIS